MTRSEDESVFLGSKRNQYSITGDCNDSKLGDFVDSMVSEAEELWKMLLPLADWIFAIQCNTVSCALTADVVY